MSRRKYKTNIVMEMIGCFLVLVVNLWVMLAVALRAFGVGIKWYWVALAIIINTIVFSPSEDLINESTVEEKA